MVNGAEMLDCEGQGEYVVGPEDLVTHFAKRFPGDKFRVYPVLASAILMLWGERECMKRLGELSFGHTLQIGHRAFVPLGRRVQVHVRCFNWFGRLTEWTFRATVGDRIVAAGVLTMSVMDPAAFERLLAAEWAVTRTPYVIPQPLKGELDAELAWLAQFDTAGVSGGG